MVGQLAGQSGSPRSSPWTGRASGEMDAAGFQFHDKQQIVSHQTTCLVQTSTEVKSIAAKTSEALSGITTEINTVPNVLSETSPKILFVSELARVQFHGPSRYWRPSSRRSGSRPWRARPESGRISPGWDSPWRTAESNRRSPGGFVAAPAFSFDPNSPIWLGDQLSMPTEDRVRREQSADSHPKTFARGSFPLTANRLR